MMPFLDLAHLNSRSLDPQVSRRLQVNTDLYNPHQLSASVRLDKAEPQLLKNSADT